MPIDPADVTNSNTDLNSSDLNSTFSTSPVNSNIDVSANNQHAQANHFNSIDSTDQGNVTYPANLNHQSNQQQNVVHPINLGAEQFVSPSSKTIESADSPVLPQSQEQVVPANLNTEHISPPMVFEQTFSEQVPSEKLPILESMEVSTIAPSNVDTRVSSEVPIIDSNINTPVATEPEVVNLQTPVVEIQDVDPDAEELTKFADEEEENLIHGIRHAHGLE